MSQKAFHILSFVLSFVGLIAVAILAQRGLVSLTVLGIVFGVVVILQIGHFFLTFLRNIKRGISHGFIDGKLVLQVSDGARMPLLQLMPAMREFGEIILGGEEPMVTIRAFQYQGRKYHGFSAGLPAQVGTVPQSVGMEMLVTALPGNLPGKIYVQKANGPILLGIGSDLESVDFNHRVIIRASDRQLPFAIFPPDFMDWYLQEKDVPGFFLSSDTCLFLHPATSAPPDQATYLNQCEAVLKYIEKSGALEKKAEPMFPRLE